MAIKYYRMTALSVLFCILSGVACAQQEPEGLAPAVDGAVIEASPLAGPLELSIDHHDKVFKVREKVAFDLVVTNRGKFAVKAFVIDNKTTFCSFNDQHWGTTDPSGEPSVILQPGESIRKKFKISGMAKPQELNIMCSYGMGINGLRPSTYKTMNIVR